MTFEEACALIPSGGRLCYVHNLIDKWEAAVFIYTFDIGRGEGVTVDEAILNAISNTHPRQIFYSKPVKTPSKAIDLLSELGL